MPFMVAVSHVCRFWRGLTFFCPTLWTKICVPVAPSYQHWPYSTLAMQLERSGELLLDVTITARFDSPTDVELYHKWSREWRYDLPGQFARVGRQLGPHAQRIRTLIVHLAPVDMWGDFMIFGPNVAGLEQLTELEILGDTKSRELGKPVNSAPSLGWSAVSLPRLQRMHFHFVNIWWGGSSLYESACRQLVHLDLGYFTMPTLYYSNLVDALGQHPAMQTLSLAVDSIAVSLADVEAQQRLLLSNLRSLRLYEVDPFAVKRRPRREKPRAGYLFSLLDAPCLRSLDLTGDECVFDLLSYLADGGTGFGGLERLHLVTDTSTLDIPRERLKILPHASAFLCEVEMCGLPAAQAAMALWSHAEVSDLPSPRSSKLEEHLYLMGLLEKNLDTPIRFSLRSQDIVSDGGASLRAGVVTWIRENLQHRATVS
jgi:hypothetical protein